MAKSVERVSEYMTRYVMRDGRELYLLAEGRLINLVAAEGHPPEIMDLSFSLQALAVKYLLENKGRLERRVYTLPAEIDDLVARSKLETMGIKLEKLTDEQLRYLSEWSIGT
jgi:adenosylhomocysteinase